MKQRWTVSLYTLVIQINKVIEKNQEKYQNLYNSDHWVYYCLMIKKYYRVSHDLLVGFR